MSIQRVVHFGEDITLFHGDCRDMLHLLASVDAVITDPPYEKHMHEAKRGKKVYGSQRRIRIDGHANPPPVDFASIDGMREEITAALVDLCNGWLLAFCTPEGIAPWRDAIEATGGRYKRALFWYKPDSAPQFNGQGPAMGVEAMASAWCGDGCSKWNGGGRRNMFTHLTNNSERHGVHPTEKPLSLMRELVDLFTNAGDLVFDPFMGSGTTGVAAAQMGRPFIGVELNERYFEIACERISQALREPDLFVARPAAKQETLGL